MKPYQFMVKDETLNKALVMTQTSGLSLAPFMRMALEQFVKRPLAVSIHELRKHESKKRRTK